MQDNDEGQFNPIEIAGYEDNYDAYLFETFEDFRFSCETFWLGDFAHYNIPVWLNYDAENKQERPEPCIEVGVMYTRKGRTAIQIAPATPGQVEEIRRLIMEATAHRADMGFERYTAAIHEKFVTADAP